MTMSRRKSIAIIGGGVVLAALGGAGVAVTRTPKTALEPWALAGGYSEPRRKALSFALLAPNPHNRQPWLVDLATDGEVVLYADLGRLLPDTDPMSRQITIGLGCFLELMRMAAAQDGYRVDLNLFPEGENPNELDHRPIARAVFVKDASLQPDPLFAQVPKRRSLKEAFDVDRPVQIATLEPLKDATVEMTLGHTVRPDDIAELRFLTTEALKVEIETPRTYKESVDLFRIGHREVDANPDGIDFSGPMFETLRLTGVFSRETALDTTSVAYKNGMDVVFASTMSAMGYVWLVTPGNSRSEQILAGQNWLRVNLAATGQGLGLQPLSQALQEYPEMAQFYQDIHGRLAPNGGTVQMFGRIGYGPEVAPSPRWKLEEKIVKT